MLKIAHRTALALAAAGVLGALALSGPSLARAGDAPGQVLAQPADAPVLMAQASVPPPPPTAQAAAPAPKRAAPAVGVEAQIKDLHRRLHITAAEETLWNGVAQVMRENDATMAALVGKQAASAGTMNAVEDLQAYSEISDAHAEGLKKFIPAFQALYDALSDKQKKAADTLFRNRIRARTKAAAPKAE